MSVQVLVDCVKANGTNGCNGGDPTAAYSYIFDHGVPDETCSNYEVLSFTELQCHWNVLVCSTRMPIEYVCVVHWP